ncbi:MAG: LamG domain-containing protein, partial [Bacteroidales bacterium]|nr:LamG domain-containing protein [Bacteroidales bacterium]
MRHKQWVLFFAIGMCCSLAAADPQPVAWYPLDKDVSDPVGYHDGSLDGDARFVSGGVGDNPFCLLLEGGGDKVIIPRMIQDDFTIAFWVRTTDSAGDGQWYRGAGLVDGEVGGVKDDFGIVLLDDHFAFGVGNPDTTIASDTRINDGQWHHVAATRDESTGYMVVYVDGEKEGQRYGPTGTKDSPSVLCIGALQTNINFFDGQIDDLRIYDIVVSASHISSLARQTVSDPDTGNPPPPPVNTNSEWAQAMVSARSHYSNQTHAIWKEIVGTHPIAFDWFLQDQDNSLSNWLKTNRSNHLEKQLIQSVFDELINPDGSLLDRFNTLKSQSPSADSAAWLSFYQDLCE